MFAKDMKIEGYDAELWAALQGERQRQEDHIELIASENYASPRVSGGAGFRADQQVCRGLSGQALLRRLRVRRYRRAVGHRSGEAVVQCRLRQRPAALRVAGQCRGLPRAATARRHHTRYEPRRRRASHAWLEGEFLRQAVQCGAVRPESGDRCHRLRSGGSAGAGAPAEDGRGGIFRLLAAGRLAAVPRHRRQCRRLAVRRHGTCRRV